jgi:hypothetical protein
MPRDAPVSFGASLTVCAKISVKVTVRLSVRIFRSTPPAARRPLRVRQPLFWLAARKPE